jgi:hypothetical protein
MVTSGITIQGNVGNFGIVINDYVKLPVLVVDQKNNIALLVYHDPNSMYNTEADAIMLTSNGVFKQGEYVKKLNLDYWRIADKNIEVRFKNI